MAVVQMIDLHIVEMVQGSLQHTYIIAEKVWVDANTWIDANNWENKGASWHNKHSSMVRLSHRFDLS